MSYSKNITAYPPELISLVEFIHRTRSSPTYPCPDRKAAVAFRFRYYAFKRALRKACETEPELYADRLRFAEGIELTIVPEGVKFTLRSQTPEGLALRAMLEQAESAEYEKEQAKDPLQAHEPQDEIPTNPMSPLATPAEALPAHSSPDECEALVESWFLKGDKST